MKRKMVCSIIGSTVSISAIWFGAWGQEYLQPWTHFPCFATAFIFFVAGIVLALSEWIKEITG